LIGKGELQAFTQGKIPKSYNIDWDAIISDIEEGGGKGHIDFQQFMSACVNRKKLKNKADVKAAFSILDADNDGKISLNDLDDIFCSYGGAKITSTIWK
jgi:Ca2+-binding EF-hand superfamily protein